MKIFEIIFILLLMIPVAVLMRFLVSRLSAETPKQVRRPHDNDEVSVRALRHKSKRKKAEKKKKKEPEPPEPAEEKIIETDFVPRTPEQQRRSERVPFSEIYGDEHSARKSEPPKGRRISPRKPMTAAPVQQPPRREAPPVRQQPQREVPAAREPGRVKQEPPQREKPKRSGLFSKKTVLLNAEEIRSRIADTGKKQPRSETEPSKRQKRKQRARSRKRKQNKSKREN